MIDWHTVEESRMPTVLKMAQPASHQKSLWINSRTLPRCKAVMSFCNKYLSYLLYIYICRIFCGVCSALHVNMSLTPVPACLCYRARCGGCLMVKLYDPAPCIIPSLVPFADQNNSKG